MKTKTQLTIIAGMVVVFVLIWGGWYLLNMPGELKSDNISDIRAYINTEAGLFAKKVSSAKDKEVFVQLFNTFEISPRLNRPGGAGGWLVSVGIERNVFPGDTSLQFIGQVIRVNGKAYDINEDAVDKVKELFFQEDFGEVIDRRVGNEKEI